MRILTVTGRWSLQSVCGREEVPLGGLELLHGLVAEARAGVPGRGPGHGMRRIRWEVAGDQLIAQRDAVQRRERGAVVRAGADDPRSEEWEGHDILEEGYVAIVGAGHPLVGRSAVRLQDLAEEAWVTDDPPESFWFDRIAAACRAAGYTPRIEVNPGDFPTVLGFVATGDYVTVQPSVIASDLRADVVAIPLAPPSPRRRLRVQVRRAISRNPAARFIVEGIHELAAERAREIPGLVDLSAPGREQPAPAPELDPVP